MIDHVTTCGEHRSWGHEFFLCIDVVGEGVAPMARPSFACFAPIGVEAT
jgi:hypothetical protein